MKEIFLPSEFFLRLDPLAALALPLALREFIPSLLPGLGVLLLAVFFGRVFCGYICPMGATLDLFRLSGGLITGREKKLRAVPGLHRAKYLFLAVLLGSSLAGVNLVFWGSPLALITRFYSLFLHPLLLLAADFSLEASRPLLSALDFPSLAYASLNPRRFDSMYFILFFFGLLFVLEGLRPRFWCSCLCPAGALLGLCSRRPLWRRRVGICGTCGQCSRICPSGAILAEAPRICAHSECFACRACADICPVRGTSFAFRPEAVPDGDKVFPEAPPVPAFLPPRRAVLGMVGAGVILASVQYSGVYSLLRPAARGNVWPDGLLRPPGSLPEAEFLLRCLRCGQCMKACPTNGLQPAGPAFGPEALFSPVLLPRRGPCEPECNLCGLVCPSKAISSLRPEEKQWAKIGTAVVLRRSCLAWAEGRRCVVCQEVCPYGAISLSRQENTPVPVPLVLAARCFGCGYCEQHCPVRLPAIVVKPLNALRLAGGSYPEAAREAGLELILGDGEGGFDDFVPAGELPPGFTE